MSASVVLGRRRKWYTACVEGMAFSGQRLRVIKGPLVVWNILRAELLRGNVLKPRGVFTVRSNPRVGLTEETLHLPYCVYGLIVFMEIV